MPRGLSAWASGRRHAAPGAASLLLLGLAASCGSTGNTDPDSSPGVPRSPPTEGTILYREPLPTTGRQKKTIPPKTFIFTTAEEGIAEESPVRTYSGTVPPGADAGSVARRLLGGTQATPRLLSREKFAELWERLASTGILELPRYRGKGVPEREDHFIFQSPEARIVITRPAIASPPHPDDPGIARLDTWRKAKLALFDYINER